MFRKYFNIDPRYALATCIFIIILLFNVPLRVVCFVNILSLLVLGYGIKEKQGTLLSPFLIISGCLYVFHCGHIWLALFNINPEDLLIEYGRYYKEYDIIYIIEVYKEITMLLIAFMFVGLCAVRPIDDKKILDDGRQYEISNLFRIVFYVLYCIALYIDYGRAIAVSMTSYGEGFLYSSSADIYLVSLVNILLLFFMYIYRNDPKQFKLFLLLQVIRALLIIFFVGNRGTSVIYLLLTLFIVTTYSYMSKDKRKIRRTVLVVFAFLIIIMPFVSLNRGATGQSENIEQFLQNNNPIENFLEEFGGTAQNVFMAKSYCSSISPTYGVQILATTLSIIPGSTFLFGNIITKYVSIGGLFNDFFNVQGLGGSMLAQLYFNFDYSVWLFMSIILVSLFVSWVSNKLMNDNLSLYSSLVFLCLFSGLLTWVRGEWYEVIGDLKMGIYVMLIIYLFKSAILIEKK